MSKIILVPVNLDLTHTHTYIAERLCQICFILQFFRPLVFSPTLSIRKLCSVKESKQITIKFWYMYWERAVRIVLEWFE